ncbi:MAG: PD-(D/E)XK nuclease family protein, partial [Bryobacteraceae bacterium]
MNASAVAIPRPLDVPVDRTNVQPVLDDRKTDLPSALGEKLSPSQVRCFMDCQARWWFKYGLKYPDPPTGNLALGRAVHAALGQNFAQKLETCEDLPVPGVIALFREAWANEAAQTEFRDDEDSHEFATTGEALVAKYMDEVAPTIEPAAVELQVAGEIGGIQVQGWIDLLDTQGNVIEIKTARSKPTRIAPMQKFQVATYAHLLPGACLQGRIDTLVKTKTPQIVAQTFSITPDESRVAETLYPLAQEAMRQTHYMPNRLSMMCSRRNCGYWR